VHLGCAYFSADAFSNWGKQDGLTNNDDIATATNVLLNQVVPTVAAELLAGIPSDDQV